MSFLEFDETRDFPYYRNNPRISKKGWILLLLDVPFSMILYAIISYLFDSDLLGSIVSCFTLLIPLLYLSDGIIPYYFTSLHGMK